MDVGLILITVTRAAQSREWVPQKKKRSAMESKSSAQPARTGTTGNTDPPPGKQHPCGQELSHPPWIGVYPLLMLYKYTNPKPNISLQRFSLSLDCLFIGPNNTQAQKCLKQRHHASLPEHLMPQMVKKGFMVWSMSTLKRFKIMEELQSL